MFDFVPSSQSTRPSAAHVRENLRSMDVLKSVLMTLANKLQALRCSAFALGGTLICLLLLRTFVHSIALFVVRKGFQFQMILSYSL